MLHQIQFGFTLVVATSSALAGAPLRGQVSVRGQAQARARIAGREELPGHCWVRTVHDLEFGTIRCGRHGEVLTVPAGGARRAQVGIAPGVERNRAVLAFEGPSAQGFNVRLQAGPVQARNARGDLLQVGDFQLGAGNGVLGLGAIARTPPGQPGGHYAGQCSLLVLFH